MLTIFTQGDIQRPSAQGWHAFRPVPHAWQSLTLALMTGYVLYIGDDADDDPDPDAVGDNVNEDRGAGALLDHFRYVDLTAAGRDLG